MVSNNFESRIFIAIGVLGFLGGLICFSPNITGNVIGDLGKNSSNLIGTALLAVGLASVWAAKIED